MPRLPVPGQDLDEWGTILNSFLRVNHGADGALNAYTLAGLPAAGTAGRLAHTTDTLPNIRVDDGSGWRALLDAESPITTTHAGPHAIGGAAEATHQLRLGFGDASATAGSGRIGFMYNGVLAPDVGGGAWGTVHAPNFTRAASGAHSQFVGIEADWPHITGGGAATVDNIYAINVGNDGAEPFGQATGNVFAIRVANGTVRVAGLAGDPTRPAIRIPNNSLITWEDAAAGFTNAAFLWANTSNQLLFGAGNTTRMWIHPDGVITIGNATTLAAGAGQVLLNNNAGLFARNAANTVRLPLINANGSDIIQIGSTADVAGIRLEPGTGDIRWGKALVALGGGAGATLGTIGGSGPATATQNTWMRLLDSTGAAFWVPAWK